MINQRQLCRNKTILTNKKGVNEELKKDNHSSYDSINQVLYRLGRLKYLIR